jgi:anti-anti-sigma factor
MTRASPARRKEKDVALQTAIEVRTEYRRKMAVARPSGALDAESAEYLVVDSLALPDDWSVLVLDLSDVDFIDSAGLASIVSLFRQVTDIDKSFGLCSLGDMPRRVMELSRLNLAIPTYRDIDDVVESLR